MGSDRPPSDTPVPKSRRDRGRNTSDDLSPLPALGEDGSHLPSRRATRHTRAVAGRDEQEEEQDHAGHAHRPEPKDQKAFLLLALAALGVVYGDIGTSPLYAVNDIFFGHSPIALSQDAALGSTSLILWAITIVVTIKYVWFVLQADHHGEGGVFALLALLQEKGGKALIIMTPVLILAAGLLYGDGLITPAISVLGAIEGIRLAAPNLGPYIVTIAVVIITGLFAFQSRGTERVGRLFGPVVLVWFAAIAVVGSVQIALHPQILAAWNPLYAIRFLMSDGGSHALGVMGSVILVVTGGEALYADMGHFGKKPIRAAWLKAVYPALIVNYLGQGAYIYGGEPVRAGNIFYSLVPDWGLIPMIVIATAAAIIASQALITGAYSLTQQAIALGLFPRFQIVHTSGDNEGQIYLPFINRCLWAGCILLVIGFQESVRLAAAYGLAVAGVMLATSIAMMVISHQRWGWPQWRSALVFLPLAAIDVLFLAANSLKFFDGGWVPLVIGGLLFIIMTTWYWGRQQLADSYRRYSSESMTVQELIHQKAQDGEVPQLPRSIVFMASRSVDEVTDRVPTLLQLFFDRFGALPKHVIFLTVRQEHVPFVRPAERYRLITFDTDGRHGTVMSVQASYGYMERPEVRKDLSALKGYRRVKMPGDPRRWLVLAGQENVLVSEDQTFLYRMRMALFRVTLRNSAPAWQYFGFGADSGVTTETIHVRPRSTLPPEPEPF